MPKSKFVFKLPRRATTKQCHDFSEEAVRGKSKDQNTFKVFSTEFGKLATLINFRKE